MHLRGFFFDIIEIYSCAKFCKKITFIQELKDGFLFISYKFGGVFDFYLSNIFVFL